MRYTLSLLLLSGAGILVLNQSLNISSVNQKTTQEEDQDAEDYNELDVDPTPPQGLNDQSTQYWYSLTPEQKQAVRQDIQNGVDPNQAVLNYAQKNNQVPSNVEGSGTYPTDENYDTEQETSQNMSSNIFKKQNMGGAILKNQDNIASTKNFSGSGSSEDEERKKEEEKDPSNRTPYAPGGENSPAPGNQW